MPPKRIKYYLTPKGFAEKPRLTYQYMEYSLRLYHQTRLALREALEPPGRQRRRRVVLYATGEVAELAYLTLKELGVEPVAILDGEGGAHFLGQSVRDAGAIPPEDYDYMVVATLDRTE
ncbi:MAG: hypothetical protein WAP47_07280 [Candidatus Rokuibacteriota bacterium]